MSPTDLRDNADVTSTDTEDEPEARLSVSWMGSDRVLARRIAQPVNRFLHTEIAGGIVLLVAAVIAVVWANSPVAESYFSFFETHLVIDLAFVTLDESILHWINDLLMAVFFFVVGLEIKRELVHGELRDPKAAMLPVVGAIGGMVVPALLYTSFNVGGPGVHGWGVPMATDIAFAVGVLALVGNRAPASLKVFLLTLAIVDDVGAILVIAVFYTAQLELGWLALAGATVVAILGLQRMRVYALMPYIVAAGVLWLAVFESGVHATIAGVALGLLTPAWPLHPPEAVTGTIHKRLSWLRARPADGRGDENEQLELEDIARLSTHGVSPLTRLEHLLHTWSSYVILPLFALANAGVALDGDALGGIFSEPVTVGIIVGLVVGKPLGVMASAWLANKLAGAKLPRGVGWLELAGVGLLAGIGFTVAIFIAGLAFTDPELTEAAKIGIFAASIAAGVLGAAALAARKTT